MGNCIIDGTLLFSFHESLVYEGFILLLSIELASKTAVGRKDTGVFAGGFRSLEATDLVTMKNYQAGL